MKIIHVTDPHVRPAGQTIYGIDSASRLRAVVADINDRHADADLVAITGDLTHHGEPDAYARLREILGDLKVPFRLMLGNHDQRAHFRAAFPQHPVDDRGFVQSALDAPGRIGRLLFLDTHEEGWIAGRMCEQRLAWLAARLDEAGERPVTIFQHHPPLPVGAPHFDAICLDEPQAYLALLARHRAGVRHVFVGHIHVPLTGMFAGGLAFTAGRGCAHQMVVDLNNPDTPWAAGQPNYNIVLLGEDDLFIHSFDMIDAPSIGTASAPRQKFEKPVEAVAS
jgi:3',5'-cyclic AMP phosphodiesterase CpdA